MQCLKDLIADLERRATACEKGRKVEIVNAYARLGGKASAYKHAAQMAKQALDLLPACACPSCGRELVCEPCASVPK